MLSSLRAGNQGNARLLRGFVARILDQMWSKIGWRFPRRQPPLAASSLRENAGAFAENDTQRSLQGRALNMAMDLGKTRWLMYEQATTSVSTPLLVVLVSGLLSFSSASASLPLTTRPWSPAYSSPRCRFPAQSS